MTQATQQTPAREDEKNQHDGGTHWNKAHAPEYQGALGNLSVNASLSDVLTRGIEELRTAERTGEQREKARCGLAVAEAHRRLGHIHAADTAWKASFRAARAAQDPGAMAWALWSGGTLARQRGAFPLAYRLLTHAAELAHHGNDRLARGYSLAGLAETGRIQGDYAAVTDLHEQLLTEARTHGEARHTVWALEGIAQMHRNTGAYNKALTLFKEAAETAATAEDHRGHAWALRGIADILSARDNNTEQALTLLKQAETICQEMTLTSALAYNHKMQANVLYRAANYTEAEKIYDLALTEFTTMNEPRGTALSQLGLIKSRAHLGSLPEETATALTELRTTTHRSGLHHTQSMIDKAAAELGVAPLPTTANYQPLSTSGGTGTE